MSQVSDVLDQLGDDGAVLMMYLADELSADDRARVERRLDADAGLRDRLEALREAQDQFFATMPALDAATRLAVPESVGVRRVAAAVRQWQAARLARPVPAPTAAPSRMPRWGYAVATAAAAVIAFVVWWGVSDRGDPRVAEATGRRHIAQSERPAMYDLVAMLMRETSGPIEAPDEVASLIEPSDYAVLTPIMSEPEPAPSQQPGRTEPAEHESEQDDWFLL
jgi:anti-sigma factor RsiW